MRARFLVCAILASGAGAAHADIYKCVDEAGHVTYTNDLPAGIAGCTLLAHERPTPAAPATTPRRTNANKTPTPASFPRVDDATQKTRDDTRRQILDNELASEQKLLGDARQALARQQAQADTGESLQQYRDRVSLHERNIDAIRKEISRLK